MVTLDRVCVYCASSRQSDVAFRDAAHRVGAHLARAGLTIVYGGGAVGSMGALADGALSAGGRVIGVLPRFMSDLEWGHAGIALQVVADMHERKRTMLDLSQAVVALPGGCGTWEELLEAMAWKRLGLWNGPIVVLNQDGFYDPLVQLLDRAIVERFMDPRHGSMWSVAASPEEVVPAVRNAPSWAEEARSFAVP